MKNGTTCKTTKRYPRVTAGPLRNQYVHRVVAAAMLGRELTKDEEVHHIDADRRNFWFANLMVLGSKDHGWVSAKQAWFMQNRDTKEKEYFDEFLAKEKKKQDDAFALKNAGHLWYQQDGYLQSAWEVLQCTSSA